MNMRNSLVFRHSFLHNIFLIIIRKQIRLNLVQKRKVVGNETFVISYAIFSPSYGIVTSSLGRGHGNPPALPSNTTPLDRVAFVLFPGVSSPAPGTHV